MATNPQRGVNRRLYKTVRIIGVVVSILALLLVVGAIYLQMWGELWGALTLLITGIVIVAVTTIGLRRPSG